MKIRCKNCYRVLNENENYCTVCGEHSEEMSEYMRTGIRKVSQSDKLKTALLYFVFIAFLGTGVLSIGLAIIEGAVGENLIYDVMGKLVTSTALFSALVITFRKELKDIFFKGTKQQILGAFAIGFVFMVIVAIISTLTKVTRVIPKDLIEFLDKNEGFFPLIQLIFTLSLIVFCEEYIYRHRLINFFDEDTMLSDGWIVVLTSIISTALSFAWFMSVEIVIMTFVINVFMSLLYIYTNRSLGINIILKIVLYLLVIALNLVI